MLSLSIFAQNQGLERAQEAFKTQQEHIHRIVYQLKNVDKRIDSDIKAMVDMLTRFKDTRDSNSRILRNKEKIIRDLKETISFYSSQYKKLTQDALGRQEIRLEDTQKIQDWLDKKIEQRLKDVVQITNSLEEYKAYYDRSYRYSKEKSNAKDADRMREKLIGDMKKAIAELEKNRDHLEKEFAKEKPSKDLSLLSKEITAINKKIDLLEHSIQDTIYGGKEGQGVSKNKARIIDKEIREKVSDLDANLTTLSRGLNTLYIKLKGLKQADDLVKKYENAEQKTIVQ